MAEVKYISIKSVLYDLSTNLPEGMWNEALMLEWANKALRKINNRVKKEQTIALRQVTQHTAKLPSDAINVIQVAYKIRFAEKDLEYFRNILNLEPSEHVANPDNLPTKAVEALYYAPAVEWKPMRAATNSFHLTVGQDPTLVNSKYYDTYTGNHEYSISPDGCITTTLKDGWIIISYLRYPKDDCGDALIPDNENLKDALFHFCMYRYWLSKRAMKEQGAAQEADWHLSMFETLAIKAAPNLSVDELESIKSYQDRLVPRDNMHEGFFTRLGHRETEPYNYNYPKYW